MKRALVILLAASLAACTTTTAGTTTPPVTITSIAQEVQTVCAEVLPIAALVPAVGVYGTAFCSVDALVANASPADLAWISKILGEIKGNVKPVASA